MITPPGHRREVSCLALTFFLDYLDSRRVPRSVLLVGLPYPQKYLEDQSNWIDYPTFLEIERRMGEIFRDTPDLYFQLGLSVGSTKGFGFIRVISRAVFSPFQIYQRFPELMKRFLFPYLTAHFVQLDRNHAIGHYRFAEGFEPSAAFLETVRGIIAGAPQMMGAPQAQVTMRRLGPLDAEFSVTLETSWLGPLDMLRRAGERVVKRVRNMGDAIEELERTNRLLQEKVAALTDAKQSLDRKVRQLSILNRLSREVTSQLDPQALVQRAVEVISTELRDVPVALLLSRGDDQREPDDERQPGAADRGRAVAEDPLFFEIAATAHLSMPETVELLQQCQPGEALPPRVEPHQTSLIRVWAGCSWNILPLVRGAKILGVLVLQVDQDRTEEPELLEPLATELAVALDNARSYRVIAELRDSLEVRVLQRTNELERARAKLEETVVQLERSDKARRDFFTNVSHEFKTPLTLILAPLTDLEHSLSQIEDPEAHEGLEQIRRNAFGLQRLIAEILDFARLEAEQMTLAREEFDLVQLALDAASALAPLAERRSIRLASELPDQPLTISGDRRLLHRALSNLLLNAIKYCVPHDQVTIRLTLTPEQLRLEVADTGPGIQEDQQERIFERFHRVRDARGQTIEGSGIGLAMVKEIVQLHQGQVRLHSVVGQGSCFSLLLPVSCLRPTAGETRVELTDARAPLESDRPGRPRVDAADPTVAVRASDNVARAFAAETDPTHFAQAELPAESGRRLSSLPRDAPAPLPQPTLPDGRSRVLLVEDNPDMRQYMTRLLSRQHQVLQAVDGQQGLEQARRELPDVVVSDVMMPVCNGFELCRLIKADEGTRNIPVVLVSAMHDTESSVMGFAAGANDFVVKPFSAPELLARINAQIRIRTLARAVITMEKQTTLGLMASSFAHEVLNPVNAVLNAVPPLRRGLTELLAQHDLNSEQARLMETLLTVIDRSGGRIRDVVKVFLTFTSHGDTKHGPKEARLSEGIDAVLGLLGFRLDERVRIHKEFRADDLLLCYPELLNQAVLNLVKNALDALPESQGNIWIVTERIQEAMLIRVRDDGMGIPWADRERIFTPFYTTKPTGAGTGMGLCLVRDIVELHGGKLEVISEPGHGSEFIIQLPLRIPSSKAREGLHGPLDPSARVAPVFVPAVDPSSIGEQTRWPTPLPFSEN